MNTITYNRDTLKCTDKIDGIKRITTFKTISDLMEEYNLTKNYIDNNNDNTKLILI